MIALGVEVVAGVLGGRVDSVDDGIEVGYRDLPGMRVTVYLPPNLLGWKMSDVTVAIATYIQSAHLSLAHVDMLESLTPRWDRFGSGMTAPQAVIVSIATI